MKTSIEVSEFANRPVLKINEEGKDKPVISFGLKKAKAIIKHIDDIKTFVEENTKE